MGRQEQDFTWTLERGRRELFARDRRRFESITPTEAQEGPPEAWTV